MLNYDDKHINDIVNMLIRKKVSVEPIGNHHLKRHLVYHCKDDIGNSFVFKLFSKKNKWNREVASLKLLSKYEILCPKLIDYGVLEDNTEWVMIEHKKGKILEKVMNNITCENLYMIYEKIGDELGKIHSIDIFKYFGNWDENCNPIDKYEDYYNYFKDHVDRMLVELFKQNLKERELHKIGANLLMKNLDIVKQNIKPSLCHNDFGERNLIICKKNNKWDLNSIIDFEQSVPSDREKELISIYSVLLESNKNYAEAFRKGYEKHLEINDENLCKKKAFYRLYSGLGICSWAVEQAPDYYKEGINLIKENIYNLTKL